MLIGIGATIKMYSYSFTVLHDYEDYLDVLQFETAKAGHVAMPVLVRSLYKSDMYSAESRSN